MIYPIGREVDQILYLPFEKAWSAWRIKFALVINAQPAIK